MSSSALAWLIETLLVTSALLILVLLIRKPVARLAGPRWAYLLWLIPALRFAASLAPKAAVAPLVLVDASQLLPAMPILQTIGGAFDGLFNAVVVIWASGTALALLRLVHQHWRLRAELLAGSISIDNGHWQRVVRCSQSLGMHPAPETRLARAHYGPAVFGLVEPILILPRGFFEDYSDQQQELMICHELTHLCRRDLLWNIVASFLRCLFWFNPLFRFCEQCYRADQELACDDAVIAGRARADRKAYGLALLSAVQSRSSAGVASFLDQRPQVSRRIRFLTHRRRTLPAAVFGFSLILLLSLAGSTLGVAPASFDYEQLVSSFVAPEPITRMAPCN